MRSIQTCSCATFQLMHSRANLQRSRIPSTKVERELAEKLARKPSHRSRRWARAASPGNRRIWTRGQVLQSPGQPSGRTCPLASRLPSIDMANCCWTRVPVRNCTGPGLSPKPRHRLDSCMALRTKQPSIQTMFQLVSQSPTWWGVEAAQHVCPRQAPALKVGLDPSSLTFFNVVTAGNVT